VCIAAVIPFTHLTHRRFFVMQRVTIQLSTVVVALSFAMATFAQEPVPSALLV
jgi:hypothetical protein